MNLSSSLINRIYIFCMYAIIFGTTLIFSTATRSVFEVNKLAILKISISILGIVFFYDRLIGKKEWFFSFKKNKWFNGSILLVWISNILSTIFSKNLSISIWGSYDRWEGILTVSLYLFLTYLIANKKGINNLNKLVWGVIIASGLSCLYGIVQSFGLDIVQWSMDPSKRVFGSINNPVHYCAILGMSIPVVIGKLFYTIKENNNPTPRLKDFGIIILYYIVIGVINQFIVVKSSFWYILCYIFLIGAPYIIYAYQYIKKQTIQNTLNILFNSILLITYATYISYSRATWLGLTASLGLIFAITLVIEYKKDIKDFLIATISCLLLTLFSYLFILFNLHTISPILKGVSIISLFLSFLLITYAFKQQKNISILLAGGVLILSQFFSESFISILLIILFTGFTIYTRKNQTDGISLSLLLFIFTLMNVQFSGNSFIQFMSFLLSIINLFILDKTWASDSPLTKNPIFQWKVVSIFIIFIIIISPKVYLNLKGLAATNNNAKKSIILQANNKLDSYKNVAIEGTARTSMWKSSFPWIKDHPIIGSGLDTIKYYYPKYRRPEYGKLEGGHNYTPDRLHNEYLNTLATKGLFGFVSYYLIFIGGSTIILLTYINRKNKPDQYIILGLIGGSFVYLGQVLFNFGVVATLVYFYIFIGLGISYKVNHEEN